jgi:hypothetical protein
MPQAGFEPATTASERPQTHDLDCEASEIGQIYGKTQLYGKKNKTTTDKESVITTTTNINTTIILLLIIIKIIIIVITNNIRTP